MVALNPDSQPHKGWAGLSGRLAPGTSSSPKRRGHTGIRPIKAEKSNGRSLPRSTRRWMKCSAGMHERPNPSLLALLSGSSGGLKQAWGTKSFSVLWEPERAERSKSGGWGLARCAAISSHPSHGIISPWFGGREIAVSTCGKRIPKPPASKRAINTGHAISCAIKRSEF